MSEFTENNMEKLFEGNGNLIPIKIELKESSGPVSPLYQSNLNVILTNEGNSLHLNYHYKGKYIDGVPSDQKSIDEVIAKEKAIAILQKFLALNPLGIERDVDEETKKKVGISFNNLTIQIGNEKSKIGYTLKDLTNPNFLSIKNIIDFIKKVNG